VLGLADGMGLSENQTSSHESHPIRLTEGSGSALRRRYWAITTLNRKPSETSSLSRSPTESISLGGVSVIH